MKDCCSKHSRKDKKCKRRSDKKTFDLPRRFSKKKCRNARGFTMRASCAPYKDCFSKRGGKRNNAKKR